MEDMPAVAEADGVSRIVPALITSDAVEAGGEDIDNLAFSFIAPLDTDDCESLFH